eukprot:GHVU01177528.1.p1 GENE.GHVU01177528.1~~GHVU01177528.1.p1  ORF type:complete len:109 (-),score=0.17 GHVU01177528.1:2852-3178(-)
MCRFLSRSCRLPFLPPSWQCLPRRFDAACLDAPFSPLRCAPRLSACVSVHPVDDCGIQSDAISKGHLALQSTEFFSARLPDPKLYRYPGSAATPLYSRGGPHCHHAYR